MGTLKSVSAHSCDSGQIHPLSGTGWSMVNIREGGKGQLRQRDTEAGRKPRKGKAACRQLSGETEAGRSPRTVTSHDAPLPLRGQSCLSDLSLPYPQNTSCLHLLPWQAATAPHPQVQHQCHIHQEINLQANPGASP